jgi:acyl-CoA reductase-like NAD-dependent aldehyde dehydrogenase
MQTWLDQAPDDNETELRMTYLLLIDGNLVAGAKSLGVINPATGKALATAAWADEAQANQAVAAAKRAFGSWSKLGYDNRRAYLEKFTSAIALTYGTGE